MVDIPAIPGIADTSQARAVLYQSGKLVHAPVDAIGLQLIDAPLTAYTVASVPSAVTAGAGAMIYVSNEAGGAVPAFSDGANWRRMTDRAVIS